MDIQVPGYGPKNAKLAIIGEAPGEQEALSGIPFVGMSGKLLNDCLRVAGINRQDCYLTNVVKLRPPNNEIAHYINLDAKTPEGTPAYKAYEEYLYEELKEVKPNLVLCLGRIPAYALLRRKDVTKIRGSLFTSPMTGLKVLCTLHPASAFREYLNRYLIAIDIKKAAKEQEFPALLPPKGVIRTRPTFQEAIDFMESLLSPEKKRIGFDIETSMKTKLMLCFSLANEALVSMCIPLYLPGLGDYFTVDQEVCILQTLGKVLEAPQNNIVIQNSMFDAYYMQQLCGIRVTNIDDTMVAQHLISNEFPKGLDFQTSLYTDMPYYKDEGKTNAISGYRDMDAFFSYSAKDSLVLMSILPKQLEDLERKKNTEAYVRTKKVLPALLYMQKRGVLADTEAIRKLSAELLLQVDELKRQFNSLAPGVNPQSPKQLKKLFYEDLKYKAYTKDGVVTTDEKALTRLAIKNEPRARLVLDIRRLSKMRATYLEAPLRKGRLVCGYNAVGTDTLRLSSSETLFGYGTNLQNLPKRFRIFLKADRGYLCGEVDLSQAENRIVAYTAPEATMKNAFDNGVDVHKTTASLIFRVPIEQVTAVQRKAAKACNHGLNYGMGPQRFSLLHEIPLKDATELYEQYHKIYPSVKGRYQARIKESLLTTRSVTNCYGYCRTYKDRIDKNDEYAFMAFYSFFAQSTVACKINQDGLIWFMEHENELARMEVLNQVHDSLWFQLPLDQPIENIAEALKKLAVALETPVPWINPFVIPADFKLGFNFGSEGKLGLKDTLSGSLVPRSTDEIALAIETIIKEAQDENQSK